MRLIPSNSSGSTSTFSKPTRKCSNATVREIPAFFADLPRNVRVDVLPEPSVSNKQQALQCVHGVLRWDCAKKDLILPEGIVPVVDFWRIFVNGQLEGVTRITSFCLKKRRRGRLRGG